MRGHLFRVDALNEACAHCVHCGLPAFVEFAGTVANNLRLSTSVYSYNTAGRRVRPGTIRCTRPMPDAARRGDV